MVEIIAVLLGITVDGARQFCRKVNDLATKRYGTINGHPLKVPVEKIHEIVKSSDGEVSPESVVDRLGPWVKKMRARPFRYSFGEGQTKLPGHTPPQRIEQVYRGGLVGVGGKRRK